MAKQIEQISRPELIWRDNKILASSLVVLGAAAVIYSFCIPQSPGFNIGLLACAAGIVSLRPKMSFMEQISWVMVLGCFTYLEVNAISRSDKENIENLIHQRYEFRENQSSIFWNSYYALQQYQDTMNQFSELNSRQQRQFESLVDQDKRLFEHEEKLSEATSGILIPGTAKTHDWPCSRRPSDKMAVLVGDNIAIAGSFPHVVMASLSGPLITLQRLVGGDIAVVMDVRDKEGRIVARLDENGYIIGSRLAIRKPDTSSLIVFDEYGAKALEIHYLNPKAISIEGHIYYGGSVHNLQLPQMHNGCIQGTGGGPDVLVDSFKPR